MKLGIRSTAAILLAAAGLSAAGARELGGQESLRVVTLDEAIEQALKNNPPAERLAELQSMIYAFPTFYGAVGEAVNLRRGEFRVLRRDLDRGAQATVECPE